MKPIVSKDSVVYFGEECYTALNAYLEKANHSKICILVDDNTHEHCLSLLMSKIEKEYDIEVIEIESGEIHKNIETCSGIWNAFSELGMDRKSLMINLGGGVITDLGGFIACTYKRGINYINIPTSLLAMVDASVGGKTGVDLGNLKNMVGVISESEMVLVDTEYLATLPVNQMCSGFAEMLKHGLIQDREYWEKISDLSQLNFEDLDQMIYDSVVIKNKIVSEDPTEQNVRKYLNYGHTLGHAIESFYLTHPEKPTLLHGEAIAIGMIMEAYISTELLSLTKEDLEYISSVILATFPKIDIDAGDYKRIMKLLIHDKKNENGNVYFVLLNTIGEAKYNCIVSDELILTSFEYYASL
ncbi:3-dehydroquinate synthase [Aquimarina sp. EL_43]|uniref:3-dehydroquinate synthase n=1 Tax=unclassified Aquimarina TaxID=2627091 RepID=UPI0018CBD692|nr:MULTISPECIES: 3-dehydroquinate synthase [unclassified Aquimarina]MBG6129793.1 3-dehydroquinate synthase [Aquimarina sp. EL_35]MBG6150858.1 3-dehydroquinate synthase [Aquimarina sp. EL_32]MBG6167835.1 3-dehydroquinate synthase [Aquimarina sp. EL_43]